MLQVTVGCFLFVWQYAKGPLVDGLYWETWYNNDTMKPDEMGYIYYENKLLGVPRLREIRVHSNSCQVHDDFENFISECYDSYSDSIEDTAEFGPNDPGYTAYVW